MRSAAKNLILLSSSEVISKALGFLTTVVIARRVGVDGLGDIGFIFAIYTYFALIANPGYDTIGAREIARNEVDVSGILNSIFILKFWSSILAFLALLLFCFLIPFSPIVKQLLMLQGLSLLAIPFALQYYFRGENKMHIVALSRLLQSSIYLVSVFMGVRGIDDLMRVPLAFGLSTVVGLVPMFGLILKHLSLRANVKKEQLRSLFVAAFTVGAAAICVQIYLNMDMVLLGFFKTSREVGLYASAYKIVTLASAIPSLLFASYLPYLISLRNPATKEWKTFVLTMFIIGLPTGFIIYLCAPELITIFYGSAYDSAVIPLRLLSLDIIAVFISITFAQPLLLLGKEKKYLSIVAWSAGLNLLLNLFMIPMYGMIGAAITTIFAESLVAFRSWKAMKQEVASTFTKEIIEIILIAGTAILLMFLCRALFTWNIIIAGVSFIVFYSVLIMSWYSIRIKTLRGTT